MTRGLPLTYLSDTVVTSLDLKGSHINTAFNPCLAFYLYYSVSVFTFYFLQSLTISMNADDVEPDLSLLNEISDFIDMDFEVVGDNVEDRNTRLTRRLFISIPPNERHLWLDSLNEELVRARRAASREKMNRLFRIVWVLGNRVPLPYVNYKKLYRDLKIGETIEILLKIVYYTFDGLRKLFLYYLMLERISPLFRLFINVSEAVTFSDNSFGQLLTFVLENDSEIFENRTILELSVLKKFKSQSQSDNRVEFSTTLSVDRYVFNILVDWILSEGWLTVVKEVRDKDTNQIVKEYISIIQAIKESVYNSLTWSLQVRCSKTELDGNYLLCTQYSADKKTLIFRFCDILKTFFPIFQGNHDGLLKIVTIIIWSSYILAMYALCSGIMWNYVVGCMRIAYRWFDFFRPFLKTLRSPGVF